VVDILIPEVALVMSRVPMVGSAVGLEEQPVQELGQMTDEISLNPHQDKTGRALETERIPKVGLQMPVSLEMVDKQVVQSPAVALGMDMGRALATARELVKALELAMAKVMETQKTPPRIIPVMVVNLVVRQPRQPTLKRRHPQLRVNTLHLRLRSPRVGGSGFWNG
jgi:hypothetical protein